MTHEQFEELWDMALRHPLRELFKDNSGAPLMAYDWGVQIGDILLMIEATPYHPKIYEPEYVLVKPRYAHRGSGPIDCSEVKMSNEQSLRLVAKWEEANKTPDDLYTIIKTAISSQS
jgi:hypothetical protein